MYKRVYGSDTVIETLGLDRSHLIGLDWIGNYTFDTGTSKYRTRPAAYSVFGPVSGAVFPRKQVNSQLSKVALFSSYLS